MPLINCKVALSLKCIENCILTTVAIGSDADVIGADSATFKIRTSELMEEILMISQLMIQQSNTTKSEKYQQGKAMIMQQVAY